MRRVSPKTTANQPFAERGLKLSSNSCLLSQSPFRLVPHYADPIVHYLDRGRRFPLLSIMIAGCQGRHLITFQLPFGKKTVARQSNLFGRRVVGAIKIRFIFLNNSTQLFQIEVRVPGLYRLERPLDVLYALSQRPLALCPFQFSPHA